MPIEVESAGDPTIPNPSYGEGFVDVLNLVEEPPLQHRPHAFALKHGDGGAKIAYGQLFWRVDRLNWHFYGDASTSGATVSATDANKCFGAGQERAIEGLNAKVPTIDTEDGTAMSASVDGVAGDGIPNVYHQLDGFGTVYLYWKVDLDHSDIVTKAWVSVSSTTLRDLVAVGTANTAHNRFANAHEDADGGTYRVEIGTVTEGAPIQQKLSSDAFWSTVVMTRTVA